MNNFSAKALVCRRNGKTIFRDVNFAMQAGDMLLVTGINGSGKSSLLRQLAGLLPISGGEIQWNGQNIAEDASSYQQNLQFMGHLEGLKPELTVLELLNYWCVLRGQCISSLRTTNSSCGEAIQNKKTRLPQSCHATLAVPRNDKDDLTKILASFNLENLLEQPVRLLSAGQKRRLTLTRLLLNPAKLWLLDEPATALDTASTKKLVEVIQKHCASGGMAVLVTHHDIGLKPTQSFHLTRKGGA